MNDEVQKYSREKITQTQKPQYTQISLSQNIDYSSKEYKRQKYKLFFFCWDKMAADLSIFLFHSSTHYFSLLFWLLQNLEENSWHPLLPHTTTHSFSPLDTSLCAALYVIRCLLPLKHSSLQKLYLCSSVWLLLCTHKKNQKTCIYSKQTRLLLGEKSKSVHFHQLKDDKFL
jgi:hypothetical protein